MPKRTTRKPRTFNPVLKPDNQRFSAKIEDGREIVFARDTNDDGDIDNWTLSIDGEELCETFSSKELKQIASLFNQLPK